MAFDWLVSMASSVAGISQDTLDKVEKAMPATKELLDLISDHQDVIAEAQSLMTKVNPLIPQVQKEMVDILPAAKAVLEVLHAHQQDGRSTAEASASAANAVINAHHGGHG